MRRLLLSLFALVSLSCGNTARPDYVVHIVDANGGSPFDGNVGSDRLDCQSGTVRIDVQQGSNEILTQNGTIAGGAFMNALSVEIPSYGLVTQIGVSISCSNGVRLLGATPHFIPAGYGFVDVVIGEPDTCDTLVAPTLTPARIAPSPVVLGANVLVAGGRSTSGDTFPLIQQLDPVRLTFAGQPVQSDPLTIGIGVGGAVALTETTILVVSAQQTGIFDTAATTAVGTFTALTGIPVGSRTESAVVDLGTGNGVAIVGGFDGTEATSDIVWIAADGSIGPPGALMHARRHPSAIVVGGNKLLVAGGQAEGQPLFEIVALSTASPAFAFGPTEARYRPTLTTDLGHTHVLVTLGSADPDDVTMVRATSHVLSTCTTAGCVVADGPMLDASMLRGHVAALGHTVGVLNGTVTSDVTETLVVGGVDTSGTASQAVDRFTIDAMGVVAIEAAGGLTVARDQPAAVDVGGGVALVMGGADALGNALNTVEICFPSELRPIGPL